jgi:hypothetical protein
MTKKKKTRKARAAAKRRSKAVSRKPATSAKDSTRAVPKSVAIQNRAEGLRLFKVAGRPTKEQCILVYGERGPTMTWAQRAAAGVPAHKFQAALAAKARK